ncbi:2-phosphosulfolactate phosphatase [Gracilimonas mengyeensis]|uniref:Probable 2-phosphosulfolactate phosphatase n=1 Tax=Gracilimonas mengyeensis TaxID=1302730 RepID=A0A521DEY1_9BACT|nr:2-phosphosulfolactate phosphatase [Gracilimonas mengyeensis]SMO69711.1 2-phosphosulfolactate phosphatase [Gracilimonas mengyeensis]
MTDIQHIDVFFSLQAFQEEELRGKTAVIIDVLRASSSIATAIHNGAKKVIPVADMSDAMKIATTMDQKDYLLCGEKNGIKIDGYQLGNSPAEYGPDVVKDKTLIFNTTNGTKAIKKASLANEVLVGTFLNQQSIINALQGREGEVALICSGWRGRISIEDILFAGSMLHTICEGNLPAAAKDGAKVAFGLFQKYGDDIEQAIRESDYAKRLADVVSSEDLAFCCKVNEFDVLPGMRDGILTNLNG